MIRPLSGGLALTAALFFLPAAALDMPGQTATQTAAPSAAPDAAQSRARTAPSAGDEDAAAAGGARAARELPELKCGVETGKPVVDYEFRFFAPYWVNIPVGRLYGVGERFRVHVVIRPLSVEDAEPVEIDDAFELGKPVPEHARGALEYSGAFALGEGRYQVAWKIEDEAGRTCELSWKWEAKRRRQDRGVNLTVEPGEVAPARLYLFRPERPAERHGVRLRVKLLMNLDATFRGRARVQLWRYAPMISGLRVMSRHPAMSEFALVAFSLEQQEVLFRQEFSRRIRFPDLGDAIASMKPAMVDVKTLRKGSDLEFLDELLAKELNDPEPVDAIIFLGADDRFGQRVSEQTLAQVRAKGIPVFHFNTTRFLWRGAIGNAVRSLGGKEFKVRLPYELAKAVEQLVEEILERRGQRSG
jgi:hypothetical protein